MKVTTAIILEKRIEGPNSTYPVKLRVTYNRKCRYYILRHPNNESIYLTESYYEKVMGKRPREEYQKLRTLLNSYHNKALADAEALPLFTFEAFEAKFFGKSENNKDLISSLQAKADKLRSEGRISTAVAYECSLRSLNKYTGKEYLDFDRVSISFLNEYEKWMLSEGNSLTTIGIYLRNVRTIFSDAIRKGHVRPELYPFGKDKYTIPSGRNIKKALSINEVGLIAKYPAKDGASEHRYRDYWLFSYLCNGINVKDMANLKYSNIEGDVITFIRAKTKRETKGNMRPITIAITKEIGRIIDKWGNKPGLPDTFIFPILENSLTPELEYNRVQQATKLINKYMAEISDKLELPNKVTSYTARHSFATVLKRSGASVEYISESLGHSSLATTENYLADFEIEEKRKWAAKLTQF